MAEEDFRFRRVRSISVSLECGPVKNVAVEPPFEAASVAEWAQSRNSSCKSLTLNSRTCSSVLLAKDQRGLGSRFNDLVNFMKSKCFSANYFKLQSLPDHVKVHIFSYLGHKTLGRLMVVCKEWNMLIRSPMLWSRLDFSQLRLCEHATSRDCLLTCYPSYKSRVKLYAAHINRIKPSIKFLKFSFDIGDFEDGWKEMVMSLIAAGRLRELKWADINWKETQEKRQVLTSRNNTSATWSDSELRNFSVNRKFRQRIFYHLFDVFTAVSPNLQHLQLPFDWFDNNIQAFSRLENLRSLQLDIYFAYFCVSQEKLSYLLSLLPRLQHLTLEFWMESDLGFHQYSIHAPNLTHLDISMCKGVYFHQLNLPNLQSLKTSRTPRKWAFESYTAPPSILPCLHCLLNEGTPRLVSLNEHVLKDGWDCGTYEELENVLNKVCPCAKHIVPELMVIR